MEDVRQFISPADTDGSRIPHLRAQSQQKDGTMDGINDQALS